MGPVTASSSTPGIFRPTNAGSTAVSGNVTVRWFAGDKLGIRIEGTSSEHGRQPLAENGHICITANDATYPNAGTIGLRVPDTA